MLLQVAAGQPIGIATSSDCDNHIHLAFLKDGGSYVDPSKYLDSIFPTVPKWTQICDDYKLVFMVLCSKENKPDSVGQNNTLQLSNLLNLIQIFLTFNGVGQRYYLYVMEFAI